MTFSRKNIFVLLLSLVFVSFSLGAIAKQKDELVQGRYKLGYINHLRATNKLPPVTNNDDHDQPLFISECESGIVFSCDFIKRDNAKYQEWQKSSKDLK